MIVKIIGIDCATQDPNVGLCFAEAGSRRLRILQVASGKGGASPIDWIVKRTRKEGATVLALDAPLGWPLTLANTLLDHEAGQSIIIEPDQMFRRSTDLMVEDILGKRPLEVGADRIARTALAALRMIATISERTGLHVPLLWSEHQLPLLSAIEVYPSATLRARNLKSEGYKGKDRTGVRSSILQQIQTEVETTVDINAIVENDNIFDAMICALAAFDFLNGTCLRPIDKELARIEGWIWFIQPKDIENG